MREIKPIPLEPHAKKLIQTYTLACELKRHIGLIENENKEIYI